MIRGQRASGLRIVSLLPAATEVEQELWKKLSCVQAGRVFAVDGNAYFARPGPRVIDGIELLAHLMHPDLCGWNGSKDAFVQVS